MKTAALTIALSLTLAASGLAQESPQLTIEGTVIDATEFELDGPRHRVRAVRLRLEVDGSLYEVQCPITLPCLDLIRGDEVLIQGRLRSRKKVFVTAFGIFVSGVKEPVIVAETVALVVE